MNTENIGSMKDREPATSVRLPLDLRVWLQHRAVDNSRSLSGEILARLKRSKQEEEVPNGSSAA